MRPGARERLHDIGGPGGPGDSSRPLRHQRQHGSAGVLVVGVVAALVLVTTGMLLVLQHSVQRHRVMAAADAAALHAADALRGIVPGQPCRSADGVLQAQGVRLVECRIQGFDVLIQAEGGGGLHAVRARARAGDLGVD